MKSERELTHWKVLVQISLGFWFELQKQTSKTIVLAELKKIPDHNDERKFCTLN